MKRILPAAVVAVSLLAAPALVHAKELTSATVCGTSGCNDSSHPAALLPVLMNGGPPYAGGPARAHPFYRVRVVVEEGGVGEPLRLIAVPHGGYVRGPDGSWTQTSATTLARIERLAGGLRPFPATQLPGVSPSLPRSHPDAVPGVPSPAPVAHGESFPWTAVGLIAAGLLLVVALALGMGREAGGLRNVLSGR